MKHYLFDPQISFNGQHPLAEIQLDRTQAYLRDHDVGTPLFGTAMSVEAISESAAALLGAIPRRISKLVSGEDCLVENDKMLTCRLEGIKAGIRCGLQDRGRSVFCCDVYFDTPAFPPVQKKAQVENRTVEAAVIYGSFFHGPAFQVVKRAWISQQSIIAEMQPKLPTLLDTISCNTAIPARVLECCLQTSGLWHAAFRKSMSVPLSIDQIEIYQPFITAEIWAKATESKNGTNITAYTEAGEPVLSVIGYRTKPMPYSYSADFDRLCQSFH